MVLTTAAERLDAELGPGQVLLGDTPAQRAPGPPGHVVAAA
jgi:hypothetical protein